MRMLNKPRKNTIGYQLFMMAAYILITLMIMMILFDVMNRRLDDDLRKPDWNQSRALYYQHDNHTAVKLFNGSIIIAGGNSNNPPPKILEIYEPKSGSNIFSMPPFKICQHPKVFQFPNYEVLFIGQNREYNDCPPQIWNPIDNHWRKATINIENPLILPRKNQSWVVVYNEDFGGGFQTHVALWNPPDGIIEPYVTLPNYLLNYTATLLTDNQLLLAGGQETHDAVELDQDCLPQCEAKYVGIINQNDGLSDEHHGYVLNLKNKTTTPTASSLRALDFSARNTIIVAKNNQATFYHTNEAGLLKTLFHYSLANNSWVSTNNIKHSPLSAPYLSMPLEQGILLKNGQLIPMSNYRVSPEAPKVCLDENYLDKYKQREDCSQYIQYPETIALDEQHLLRIGGKFKAKAIYKTNVRLFTHKDVKKSLWDYLPTRNESF